MTYLRFTLEESFFLAMFGVWAVPMVAVVSFTLHLFLCAFVPRRSAVWLPPAVAAVGYGSCLLLEGLLPQAGAFMANMTGYLGLGMVIGFGLGWPVGRILQDAARKDGSGEGVDKLAPREYALLGHGILWYAVSGMFLVFAIWFGSSSWYRHGGPVNGQVTALYGMLTAAYIAGTLGDLWFLHKRYPGKLPVAQRLLGAGLALAQGIWCAAVYLQAG